MSTFVFYEQSRFNYQCLKRLKRYTSYSKYFSIHFAKGYKQIDFMVAAASRFGSTISSMFLFQSEMRTFALQDGVDGGNITTVIPMAWEDEYPIVASLILPMKVISSLISTLGCVGNLLTMSIIWQWHHLTCGGACMFSLALANFLSLFYSAFILVLSFAGIYCTRKKIALVKN